MEYRSVSSIGILGGGQLGRMMIQAGLDLNLPIHVLDPSSEAPCRPYSHSFSQGSLTDFDTVYRFGQQVELLTVEIENVNTDALLALQSEGKKVYPDPQTLKLIQDKRQQKLFYAKHGFPTADFKLVENRAEIIASQEFLPAVNKLGKAGYDGRGVQILKGSEDLSLAFDEPGLIEKLIPFDKELAVLVARNPQGEISTFPVVEMVFHPVHNLVEYLFSPAAISPVVALRAQELAQSVVHALDYVGLMAVEMFLEGEQLLINEIAPRPHNSGHHTIKACATSQYEQHLRAILALPLGDTTQLCPAAMVNLLGEAGHTGPAHYQGLAEAVAIPGVYPHLYGKAETRPFRKMGHVTILGDSIESLAKKAEQVKSHLKVLSR